jgi:hypothetical protein
MAKEHIIYKSNSIYREHIIYKGIPAYTGDHPVKRGIPAHTSGKPPNIAGYRGKTTGYGGIPRFTLTP